MARYPVGSVLLRLTPGKGSETKGKSTGDHGLERDGRKGTATMLTLLQGGF